MNREQCVDLMMDRIPHYIPSKEVGNIIVKTFLDVVMESVGEGERVTFLDFGTFERAERKPRNYRTFDGEVVKKGKTYLPKFTPHTAFKKACVPKRGRPSKKES